MIWKWVLIMMHIKLIFTTKVSHLASFWKWDFLELRNGLFHISHVRGTSVDIPLPITQVTVLDIFKLWHFITKTEMSTIRYEIKSSHYNPNLLHNIALTVTRYSVCLCPSSPFPTQQLFCVKLGRVLKL